MLKRNSIFAPHFTAVLIRAAVGNMVFSGATPPRK